MKQLVIIIPGSKAKNFGVFNPIPNFFQNLFGVEKGNDDWANKLKTFLKNDSNLKVEIFGWNGGVSRTFSLKPASKKLVKLIKVREKQYDSIILFCKSAGGIIGELAIETYDGNKIHKIIFVATPHRYRNLYLSSRIGITNIYSISDYYQTLGNIFLNFGFGTKRIKNGHNIEISGLNHSQLNHNINFIYKGRKTKLFDFYKKIILS